MNSIEDKGSEIDEFTLDYKPKYQIFHELMAKRINQVLLVSSYYDSFILEEDGRLSDQIFEQFHNLNLRTLPVITRVDTANEALELINTKKFDLVITMRRLSDMDTFDLGQKIKRIQNIPVILLLNNVADVPYLPDLTYREGIDRAFLWNGDSTVFIAIIKHLEDQLNVSYDTRVGLVRVIIVIEDSIRYYSIFLPLIYSEIMKQTHRVISEGVNDYHHLLQMRTRPKILLASSYEEAMEYYQEFKEYIIGVISDVRFPKGGMLDDNAGINFIKELKKESAEHKQVEDDLRRSKDRLSLAMEISEAIPWEINLQTCRWHCNPEDYETYRHETKEAFEETIQLVESILRYLSSTDDVLHTKEPFQIPVHPDDRDKLFLAGKAVLDGKKSAYEGDHRMIDKEFI